MRAIMMKVNYDPKYTVPHLPVASCDRLNTRINVMRGIYTKAPLCTSVPDSIHDIVEKKLAHVCKDVPKLKQSSVMIKRSSTVKCSEEPIRLSIPKQIEEMRKKPLLNPIQESGVKKKSSPSEMMTKSKTFFFAGEEDAKKKQELLKRHAEYVKSKSSDDFRRRRVGDSDEPKRKFSVTKSSGEVIKQRSCVIHDSDDTSKKTTAGTNADESIKQIFTFKRPDTKLERRIANINAHIGKGMRLQNAPVAQRDKCDIKQVFSMGDASGAGGDEVRKRKMQLLLEPLPEALTRMRRPLIRRSKTTIQDKTSKTELVAPHQINKEKELRTPSRTNNGKKLAASSSKEKKLRTPNRTNNGKKLAASSGKEKTMDTLSELINGTNWEMLTQISKDIQTLGKRNKRAKRRSPLLDKKSSELDTFSDLSKEKKLETPSTSNMNLETPSQISKEINFGKSGITSKSQSVTKCMIPSPFLSADVIESERSPTDVKSAHHIKHIGPAVNRRLDRSKTITFGECFGSPKTARQRKFERRARKVADKAMKSGMVFTIVGPYPSLRQALRRRGWVERIHTMPSDSETNNIGRIQAVLTKSDTEVIDEESGGKKFSPWWLEENGFYLMMSHMLRHTTPSFVFTVKSLDTKMLCTDQLVNHFEQARHFTTKAGLCQNIRNTLWFDKVDADSFFPRCYRLDDATERTAFIDDYRLTACMSYVKHFTEEYMKWSEVQKLEKPNILSCNGLCEGSCMFRGKPNRNQSAPAFRGEHFLKRVPSSISLMVPNVTLYYNTPESLAGGMTFRKNFGDTLPRSLTMDDERYFTKHDDDDSLGKALEMAIKQCQNFIGSKEHNDIDAKTNRTLSDDEWDVFLTRYYKFVHCKRQIPAVSQHTINQCFTLLGQLKDIWPQFELDGSNNVWILKPGAKSRGRGIICLNKLGPILTAADDSADTVMVIQKYIERPFLTYNTKFDIRQWFLVTSWKPLVFWFYNDCYLRFCGQQFTLNNFHASVHLSNNSVQKSYKNGVRSDQLPEDNMWTSDEFIQYLDKYNMSDTWRKKTIPAMQKSIVCCLLCSQEYIDGRKNAFELYGADFMLTEDLSPWLLEINSSPCMSKSTHATAQLVDNVLEDTLKVVLDRKTDHACDTGGFKLIYKQPVINDPTPINKSLLVEGHAVKKRTVPMKRRHSVPSMQYS